LFSDWTREEYRRLLGYKKVDSGLIGTGVHDMQVVLKTDNLPASVDWR